MNRKSDPASRALRESFGTERARFAGAIVATCVAAVATFSVPLVIQAVLDWVLLDQGPPPFRAIVALGEAVGGREELRRRLWIPAAAIPAITAVNGVASYLAGRWSAVGAERAARGLRDRLYRHIHAVSTAYHHTVSSGDLLQRCTSDVDTVRRFFAIQLMEVGRAIAMTLVAIPVMLRLHAPLAVIALVLLPGIFWYTLRFFQKVQVAFTASDEAEGALSGVLQEHLHGLRVVRAFAKEPEEYARFSEANETHRSVTMKLVYLLAQYWSVSTSAVVVQLGAVLVAGTVFAVRGELTVGALLVFLLMEQMLLWPIRQMGMILADLGKARVAIGRIGEILDRPTEDEDPDLRGAGTEQPKIHGGVRFDNVHFRYPGAETEALRGVSFTAEPGATIGILGTTGAGKTTLMMLLSRLYDPSAGRILIDGIDITAIDRRWMRANTAFVLQEPFLFARTIRDNIAFAHSSAEDGEITAATRSAAIHDVIQAFHSGYDTAVGEKGVTLSGGQKQRVAIARALLTRSPILMFDDSLSAVDTRTDAHIRAALLERNATVFLISHRASTLGRTDHVVVLDAGRVVEQGSPRELRSRGGHFARVWRLQQGESDEPVPGRAV